MFTKLVIRWFIGLIFRDSYILWHLTAELTNSLLKADLAIAIFISWSVGSLLTFHFSTQYVRVKMRQTQCTLSVS